MEYNLDLGGGTLSQIANRSRTQMMSYIVDCPEGGTIVIDGGMYCSEDADELYTSVTIGNGVTTIGNYAFYGCTNLKNITYQGTKVDRAIIVIESNNAPLLNANWTYTKNNLNGDINEDGEVNAADLALLKKIIAKLV